MKGIDGKNLTPKETVEIIIFLLACGGVYEIGKLVVLGMYLLLLTVVDCGLGLLL